MKISPTKKLYSYKKLQRVTKRDTKSLKHKKKKFKGLQKRLALYRVTGGTDLEPNEISTIKKLWCSTHKLVNFNDLDMVVIFYWFIYFLSLHWFGTNEAQFIALVHDGQCTLALSCSWLVSLLSASSSCLVNEPLSRISRSCCTCKSATSWERPDTWCTNTDLQFQNKISVVIHDLTKVEDDLQSAPALPSVCGPQTGLPLWPVPASPSKCVLPAPPAAGVAAALLTVAHIVPLSACQR